MVPAAIIATKRDGGELLPDQIESMIQGFVAGQVADYQMTAFAMAVLLRGMSRTEISALTQAMLHSGVSLPRVSDRPRVDKHSTGGLGDSTSIVLAPLLACFDLEVPMLSGRGLGITGGTLDKLEAIPGYRCNLSVEEIGIQLRKVGCVITGTTPDIAPADRRLYALRDVTATVESVPLITASIMSKKLAETLDYLILDVKFGSGAFMATLEQAKDLASSLMDIGQRGNVQTRALLTDMYQPLGRMVGNACEINETLDMLQGNIDGRLADVTLALCAELLVMAGKQTNVDNAIDVLKKEITSGRPLARLQQMIEAQGGKFALSYPLADATEIGATSEGYIESINGRLLGQAIIELGGGRKIAGEAINHSVGIEMLVSLGDYVSPGQPLVRMFNDDSDTQPASIASDLIRTAFHFSNSAPSPSRLIQR